MIGLGKDRSEMFAKLKSYNKKVGPSPRILLDALTYYDSFIFGYSLPYCYGMSGSVRMKMSVSKPKQMF